MNTEPTVTNTPQADPSSLVVKLAQIMGAVAKVPKTGHNDFHNYDYATEADILEAVRDELAKRNVIILPSIESHERKEHTTTKGNKGYLTDIVVVWTIWDGDSGERIALRIPGCGEDAADKGFYKAFTGSEKYMLTKTFLIPTGDDPEKDNDRPPANRPAAAQVPAWAKETKAAVAKAAPAEPQSNGQDTVEGVLGHITVSADGGCWFIDKIGDFGGKGTGKSLWTRDEGLARILLSHEGAPIVAHLQSKKAGSYRVTSFEPVEEPNE